MDDTNKAYHGGMLSRLKKSNIILIKRSRLKLSYLVSGAVMGSRKYKIIFFFFSLAINNRKFFHGCIDREGEL